MSDTSPDSFYLSATDPNNSKKSEAVGFRLNKCASDESRVRRQHHMQFVCHCCNNLISLIVKFLIHGFFI